MARYDEQILHWGSLFGIPRKALIYAGFSLLISRSRFGSDDTGLLISIGLAVIVLIYFSLEGSYLRRGHLYQMVSALYRPKRFNLRKSRRV